MLELEWNVLNSMTVIQTAQECSSDVKFGSAGARGNPGLGSGDRGPILLDWGGFAGHT